MLNRVSSLLVFASLAAAPLSAQQLSADSSKALIAKGKTLYEGKGLCTSCHGMDGEGVLGPTTQLSAGKVWLHTKGTAAEIVALIKSGVPEEKTKSSAIMPPKGGSRLTDAEIEMVALYVIDLHSKKPTAKKAGG